MQIRLKKPVRQTWLYKEDILELRKKKQIKEDGKAESDAEAFRKMINKLKQQQQKDVNKIKTDSGRFFQ